MLLVIGPDQLDQPGHPNLQLFVSTAANSIYLWPSQKDWPWLTGEAKDRGVKVWTLCPVSTVRFMLQNLSCIKPRSDFTWDYPCLVLPWPYSSFFTPVQISPECTPPINPCLRFCFQRPQDLPLNRADHPFSFVLPKLKLDFFLMALTMVSDFFHMCLSFNTVGAKGRLPQDGPLWHEDYFESQAIKTRRFRKSSFTSPSTA